MCGFVISNYPVKLTDSLINRGPDDQVNLGYKDIKFSFFRLIMELSSIPQPLESDYSIVCFNGEIFNYKSLARLLQLNCNSEVEFIRDIYEKYRNKKALIEELPKLFRGQFAIVIFDKVSNQIHIWRDHFGEKSCFVYCQDGRLIISSDFNCVVKSAKYNLFELNKCKIGTKCFQLIGWAIPPNTIYNEIKELMPGGYCLIDLNSCTTSLNVYFKPLEILKATKLSSFEEIKNTFSNVIKEYFEHTNENTALLLSAGLDSRTLLELIEQCLPSSNIFVATIGTNAYFDESKFVKSNHNFHNKLNIIYPDFSYENYLNSISSPVADPSIFNLCAFSKNAKSKVVFMGDGGDEVGFGYGILRLQRLMCRFPTIFTSIFILKMSKLFAKFSDRWWLKPLSVGPYFAIHSVASNSINLKSLFLLKNIEEAYRKYYGINNCGRIEEYVLLQQLLYSTSILRKVDMGLGYFGKEARLPFLNIDVYFSLLKFHLKNNKIKYFQKKILKEGNKKDLRKKSGFFFDLTSSEISELYPTTKSSNSPWDKKFFIKVVGRLYEKN